MATFEEISLAVAEARRAKLARASKRPAVYPLHPAEELEFLQANMEECYREAPDAVTPEMEDNLYALEAWHEEAFLNWYLAD